MITESFDNQSAAIINPRVNENALQVDACILTFSHVIEEYVLGNYECRQIASFQFATGNTPIYCIDYKGKKFAFYKTYVGAPASDYIAVKNVDIVADFMEKTEFLM